MRVSKKKALITGISLVILAIAVITVFAATGSLDFRSETDLKTAHGLSALSGLPAETVLRLYDAVGSWDTVRQNIFIYKRVLSLVEPDPAAYDGVFAVVARFRAGDVLAVYEFLDGNAGNFDKAAALLTEHAKGTSFETVFATFMDTKTYRRYKPAGEEQIRQWLNNEYSPQDIINADSIARAKDIRIAAVLDLKTGSTTWEQISKKLKYKFPDSPEKVATLNIKGATGNRTVSGKDYETLIRQENLKAEQDKTELEETVRRELGFTSVQMEVYKNQGFTFRDLQNAFRLAKKSGTSMDIILQERKDGKSWETIIKTYSG